MHYYARRLPGLLVCRPVLSGSASQSAVPQSSIVGSHMTVVSPMIDDTPVWLGAFLA